MLLAVAASLWIQVSVSRLSKDIDNTEKNRSVSLFDPLCDLCVLCG